MTISPQTIRPLIGEPNYSRGKSYYRSRRVISWAIQDSSTIDGEVSGSRGRTYDQHISLQWNRSGTLTRIKGECSCPVGYNCKHVTAVMLEASPRLGADGMSPLPLSQEIGAPPAKPDGLDPAVTRWLEQMRACDVPPEDEGEDYPPQIRDRLYYVIGTGLSRRLAVTLMKITLRKDGTPGTRPHRYDASFLRSRTQPKFIQPLDRRICVLLDRCNVLNSWHTSASADDEDLAAAVHKMIETGRARWQEVDGVVLRAGSRRPAVLLWRDLGNGAQQLCVVDTNGKDLTILDLDAPYYVDPETGECGPVQFTLPTHLVSALLGAPTVPPEAAEQVAEVLDGFATAKPPLPARLERETRNGVTPVPVLELLALKANAATYGRHSYGYGHNQINIPTLRLGFDYDGHSVPLTPRNDVTLRDGDRIVVMRRNNKAEDAAIDLLGENGVVSLHKSPDIRCNGLRDGDLAFPELNSSIGYAHEEPGGEPSGGEAFGKSTCLQFVIDVVPKLRDLGWRIKFDESWPYRVHDGPAAIHAGLGDPNANDSSRSSDADCFSFSLAIDTDGQTFDLLPVVLSIVDVLPAEIQTGEWSMANTGTACDGKPGGHPHRKATLGSPIFDLDEFLEDVVLYPQMPDGSYLRIEGPPLALIVRALLAVYGLDGSFHQAEAGKVAELAEALEGCGVPFRGGEALRSLGEKLRHLATMPEAEPPADLDGTLRPYQKSGYGWLQALYSTGFGGVLADDMGLGKTIQTLALLVARHIDEGSDRPSLLVVPTSLIGNWHREAGRFAPALKMLVLHGPDRKKSFHKITDHHVIVTTYPLLHRDHEILLAHDFDLAILDEAQAVKNPAASISKRIRDIRARQRLALTGTPMENNLEELWSLFDWLIPGLLGNRKTFIRTFRTPIEKYNDKAAHKRLVSRIKPFLLRRTKEEVAPDLPEKNEITELVPLAAGQSAFYETLRSAMDDRVREAIRTKGLNASRITVLDALLKLRQVCCDPGLVKLDAARKVSESAKRARLMEMLEKLIAEGRRVLVFSQFVEMLNLIETDVKAHNWDYLMLTGRTKKRAELIDRFQSGKTPIFLISLKAGGVGLNLTAADTVILYDPWWNPAVERQAMDRTHRIGQDKAVFVYRLVAEGTVEAAIQELQARKQALADNLFEENGTGPMALTENDLTALFQPLNNTQGNRPV